MSKRDYDDFDTLFEHPYDIIYNHLKTNESHSISYWLGGRDDVVEGRWMWAQTDQVFNFTDWYPNIPDNVAGNENCLHMYAPWKLKWNDVTCAGLYRFICEKESYTTHPVRRRILLEDENFDTCTFVISNLYEICEERYIHVQNGSRGGSSDY
ncbi:unnamed protein product [Mytilus edulis]|uniref:C-type lectin domain-containing protein n=1 Tax=Mytilus edulis TaxID=6550 RepID=A0A8S3SQK7_MYTED|nr:unnamed protein product [Mytilus edulis]